MRCVAAALVLLTAGAMILVSPLTASGDCRWTWDCPGGYPYRQAQASGDSLELPPMQPPEIAPLDPIPSPTIEPVAPEPVLPPTDAQCVDKWICNSIGSCGWYSVCGQN